MQGSESLANIEFYIIISYLVILGNYEIDHIFSRVAIDDSIGPQDPFFVPLVTRYTHLHGAVRSRRPGSLVFPMCYLTTRYVPCRPPVVS